MNSTDYCDLGAHHLPRRTRNPDPDGIWTEIELQEVFTKILEAINYPSELKVFDDGEDYKKKEGQGSYPQTIAFYRAKTLHVFRNGYFGSDRMPLTNRAMAVFIIGHEFSHMAYHPQHVIAGYALSRMFNEKYPVWGVGQCFNYFNMQADIVGNSGMAEHPGMQRQFGHDFIEGMHMLYEDACNPAKFTDSDILGRIQGSGAGMAGHSGGSATSTGPARNPGTSFMMSLAMCADLRIRDRTRYDYIKGSLNRHMIRYYDIIEKMVNPELMVDDLGEWYELNIEALELQLRSLGGDNLLKKGRMS